jgi:hypothetical protein
MDEVCIGAAVFDRIKEIPARVRNIDGQYIELERPSGRVWSVYYRRLRPATDREKRQLEALDRLRRK